MALGMSWLSGCACERGTRLDAGRPLDDGGLDAGAGVDAPGEDVFVVRPDVYVHDAPIDAAAMSCDGTMLELPYPTEAPGTARTVPDSCAGCAAFTELAVTPMGTTARITGRTALVPRECRWHLVSDGCGGTSGAFLPDEFTTFAITLPLFCGTNTLQLVCDTDAGRSVATREIAGPACDGRDLQVTLAWGATANDMELHLLRGGFYINDATNDCTWFTCVRETPDWGVVGDPTDDPRKDVDNTSTFGPENIFLMRAAPGRYHVMVEYWGWGTPDTSEITITLGGTTVYCGAREMSRNDVWHVGTSELPGEHFTLVDTITPCMAAWRTGGGRGCTLSTP
jgi:hypothetical protein